MTERAILLVCDDVTRAQVLDKALAHPSLRVARAHDEDAILGAFGNVSYALAVVAGKIGRRNPLIVAEAVRLRQQGLPVLVLVDDELPAAAVEEHRGRDLDGVSYLDLGKVVLDEPALRVDLAEKVRGAVLEALGVAEEEGSAWREGVLPKPPPLPSARSEEEDEVSAELELADMMATPLPTQPVTPEDVEFARRIVEKARNIDFHKPVPQPPPSPDGPERTIAALRHRLHTLERQLARLAHVYAGRLRDFAAVDDNLSRLEVARATALQELEAARQAVAAEREAWRGERGDLMVKLQAAEGGRGQLEDSLRGATAEMTRLRGEIATKDQQRSEAEGHLRGMLKQAEDTFNALREQSSHAIDELKQRLSQGEQRQSEAQGRVRELEGEVTRLHGLVDAANQAATQAAASLHSDVKTVLDRERESQEQLLEKERSHLAEIERLMAVKDELAGELSTVRSRLQAAEDERDRFIEASRAATQDAEEAHAKLAEATAKLGEVPPEAQAELAARDSKAQELKLAAQTFRTRVTELEDELNGRVHELVELRSLLEARDAELREAKAERQALSKDAPAAAVASLENKIDLLAAELQAVFARLGGVDDGPTNPHAVMPTSERRATLPMPALSAVDEKPWLSRKVALAAALGLAFFGGVGWYWFGGEDTLAEPTATVAEPSLNEATAPTVAAAPAVAPVAPAGEAPTAPVLEPTPAPSAEPVADDKDLPTDKKGLRRGMQEAHDKKRPADVVRYGVKLRDKYGLDWEASFMLGNALLAVGNLDEARSQFEDFGKRHGTNKFAGEAYFKIAEILEKKGQKKEARLYFEKVVKESSGELQKRAQARVK